MRYDSLFPSSATTVKMTPPFTHRHPSFDFASPQSMPPNPSYLSQSPPSVAPAKVGSRSILWLRSERQPRGRQGRWQQRRRQEEEQRHQQQLIQQVAALQEQVAAMQATAAAAAAVSAFRRDGYLRPGVAEKYHGNW
ncbi:hypothetical protein DL768_005347 [Monosporascus sp. mg162]|nr:hypothetical protein DL768_005347 [Monosporascus sp. mg162]